MCYIQDMEYLYDYGEYYFSHKLTEKGRMEDDFGDHFHTGYELLLFIKGDLEYVIENRVYNLSPYDLLLIKPGEHHHIKTISPMAYERFVFRFPRLAVPEIMEENWRFKKSLYHISDSKILSKFFHFDDLVGDFKGAMINSVLKSGLDQLLFYLSKLESDESETSILDDKVNNIIKYINQNLHKRLSISDLCETFYLSKSNLCKMFHDAVKVPIIRYINNKKIMYSQELIRKGFTLSEVANKCGYADYSTFYRNYQKIIGSPPSKRT